MFQMYNKGIHNTNQVNTYKNIIFSKNIKDKDIHIFLQNKTSSSKPINAANRKDVWVFLISEDFVTFHFNAFFNVANISLP